MSKFKYPHQAIEKKWQKRWEKERAYQTKESSPKPKFYCLIEFPYPSSDGLHVGHPRSYTALDILARKRRMEGYHVLFPIGFDAFGLPAENYAIKVKKNPADITKTNINRFRKQLKSLGLSFDWSREVVTTDPKYYKWTQWIFLQLYKAGLVYQKEMPINWCPSCKIGLANEEVVAGKCERCGTETTKKNLKQWLFRITKYADRLIDDLEKVDYLDKIKTQQINWIGRSEGATVKFGVIKTSSARKSKELGVKNLEVFTTRPDTLFGATYLVLAPEHPLVASCLSQVANRKEVEKYIKEVKKKTDLERTELVRDKTGVELKGIKAINPVNNEEIPIWVADYVLPSYGTGAIMAVPAHDERDFEFARKYNLEIKPVIAPFFQVNKGKDAIRQDKRTQRRKMVNVFVKHWQEDKYLCLDWKDLGWHSGIAGGMEKGENIVKAAKREIREETGYKNLRLIKQLQGEFHCHCFVAHKGENRYSIGHGLLFELKDGKREKPAKKETEHHKTVWVEADKMDDFLNVDNHKCIWQMLKSENECFTGKGVMINSGEFSGLDSKEGIKKITKWLEKKKLGKSAMNYKLRDWIFSRQHYWGEPIPLVHCEQCRKKDKKKVLIIHGTGNQGRDIWYGWLADELKKLGHEAFNPNMPDSDKPILEKWLKALEKYKNQLDENSVVIGHSLGGVAALHFISKLNKKIGKLILVAPTYRDIDWNAYTKKHPSDPVKYQHKFNQPDILYDKVHKNTKEIIYYYSNNDFYIPNSVPGHYKKVLKADFRLLKGRNHFTIYHGDAHTFLEVLEEVTKKNPLPIGIVPIPEKDLPVELPRVEHYEPTATGESPLAAIKNWVNTSCPKCGGRASRETDTMPNWAGSNWYFIRYTDPHNHKEFASKKNMKYWLPVDIYNGGMEHTTLHLLYSRFWYKALSDLKLVPGSEPYSKRISHGMVLAEDGKKMSKSLGNVINPDEVIKEYGADTMRMYEMFMGPFGEAIPWDTKGIVGVRRFLDRVWIVVCWILENVDSEKLPRKENFSRSIHRAIKKIGEDIENFKFNTAVAKLMIFFNGKDGRPDWRPKLNSKGNWEKVSEIGKAADFKALEKFLKILSPLAPHLSSELWEKLGHKDSIFEQEWPTYDKSLIQEEEFDLVVQVNGKVRDRIKVPTDISEKEAREKALASEKIRKYVKGEPKKVIFVQGKLINFVP